MEISIMTLNDYEQIKSNLHEEYDDFWTEGILKKEIENENSRLIIAKDDKKCYNSMISFK